MNLDLEFKHISVLLNETVDGLNIKPDGIYVDGTLGGGGHSKQILNRITTGHLYGIDQDADAIAFASKRLENNLSNGTLTIIRDNYCNMKQALSSEGVSKVDGIMLDLGVSSYQLDTENRGFSYMTDAPLDMRMDQRSTMSAKEVVNGYDESDLYRIIRDYGEDPFAKNIAKHIVQMRKEKAIETTGQLNEAIRAAIPMKIQKTLGHPSKRTYQAIRIEVNSELNVLKNTLDDMVELLNPGGRLCIITFHSLEEKIVKAAYREWENPCICPPSFPVCTCNRKPKGKIINKKPILPSAEELEENSRSHSAKLRIFEKR